MGSATLDSADQRIREEFRRLCITGDADGVANLLDQAPQQVTGALDVEGTSALHLSARAGHLLLSQELLRRKCQVDALDSRGRTPLHIACMEEHADVVLELLCQRADANIMDDQKQTAMHKVMRTENLEVLRVLTEAGDPVFTAMDGDGATPLLLAAEFAKVHMLEYLLSKDSGMAHAANANGWTALHLAAHGREMKRASLPKPGKFAQSVRLLIQAKAPIEATDEDRKTALHRAANTGNPENVAELLLADANVGAEDNCRWTPLHYACQEGHLDVARQLLNAKACVQKENPSCLTPLAIATMENQVKIAELLMSFKASPNLRGKGLASPISIARKEPEKYAELLSLFELGFISHH